MKIAVPSAEGKLAMHFGHCREFVLFEVDRESKKIVGQTSVTPPAHEPGVLPKWLSEQGVNVILAGGMGMRAQNFFQQYGIEVVVGAPSLPCEAVVREYLAGTLQTGENVCDH